MMIYIIEHLEPKLWTWCIIEYKNISKIVGKRNLWFTNIKGEGKELEKYGHVFRKSVSEMKLKNACILDPEAAKQLEPKEAKKFKYFIFGGILGDFPAKKRTKKELTFKVKGEARNIGKKQFSTDNAVYVVKEIVKGRELGKMKFKNKFELKLGRYHSVILPFYYPVVNGNPLMSGELVEYLKRKRGF